jgi:hypothetical protein
MTAALINLVIIMTLTRIYHKLARWMVNMENPRTQTEYEASYTFKIFLFEFVNFYSSLIYIAFFKVYQCTVRKRCRDCFKCTRSLGKIFRPSRRCGCESLGILSHQDGCMRSRRLPLGSLYSARDYYGR